MGDKKAQLLFRAGLITIYGYTCVVAIQDLISPSSLHLLELSKQAFVTGYLRPTRPALRMVGYRADTAASEREIVMPSWSLMLSTLPHTGPN